MQVMRTEGIAGTGKTRVTPDHAREVKPPPYAEQRRKAELEADQVRRGVRQPESNLVQAAQILQVAKPPQAAMLARNPGDPPPLTVEKTVQPLVTPLTLPVRKTLESYRPDDERLSPPKSNWLANVHKGRDFDFGA